MQKDKPTPISVHQRHEQAALNRQQRQIRDDALRTGQGVLTVGYLPPQTIGDTLGSNTEENLRALAHFHALTKQIVRDAQGIVENDPGLHPLPDKSHNTTTELLPSDFIFFPPGTRAETIIKDRTGKPKESLPEEQKETALNIVMQGIGEIAYSEIGCIVYINWKEVKNLLKQ